jgi:hypothetical protein
MLRAIVLVVVVLDSFCRVDRSRAGDARRRVRTGLPALQGHRNVRSVAKCLIDDAVPLGQLQELGAFGLIGFGFQ